VSEGEECSTVTIITAAGGVDIGGRLLIGDLEYVVTGNTPFGITIRKLRWYECLDWKLLCCWFLATSLCIFAWCKAVEQAMRLFR